jgi:hypothetical protein
MQPSPQAFPLLQTLQHSPVGSTDHSTESLAELGAVCASGALEPALVMQSVSSAAIANVRRTLIPTR